MSLDNPVQVRASESDFDLLLKQAILKDVLDTLDSDGYVSSIHVMLNYFILSDFK